LPEYSVIGDEHDYRRADHSDENAVDVKAGNAGRTHGGKDPSAKESTDDSQNDVANQSFPGFVNDLATDSLATGNLDLYSGFRARRGRALFTRVAERCAFISTSGDSLSSARR